MVAELGCGPVDPAEKMVARLPASLGALERGEIDLYIDLYKVQTVHELTMNLSSEHAREVEDRVLERASVQTGAQMRQRARRIVMRVDPRGARERAAEAKAQRCVGLESEDDGMAKPFAYVPADKAVAIKLRVDKIARWSGRRGTTARWGSAARMWCATCRWARPATSSSNYRSPCRPRC